MNKLIIYPLRTTNFAAKVFEVLGNIRKMWIMYPLWTTNFVAKVVEMLRNI